MVYFGKSQNISLESSLHHSICLVIRLMDEGYSRIETAMQFGLPYVVKRKVRPYDTATLNYNWQVWNTEAFSLYNGNRTD